MVKFLFCSNVLVRFNLLLSDMKFLRFLPVIFLFSALYAQAQPKKGALVPHPKAPPSEKQIMKEHIENLTKWEMYGRGYVKDGREVASHYIQSKFREFKLKPVGAGKTYVQGFAFPVNTFPEKMDLTINGELLKPGEDYIIDAQSASYARENLEIERIDLGQVNDGAAWKETLAKFDGNRAYLLSNIDSFCARREVKEEDFVAMLPPGCYLIPKPEKLTWTVKRDTMAATVFYVKQGALPRKLRDLSANVTSLYLPHATSENIVGMIPGAVKDSFIVITSHYDHLGMMGDTTIFPGASDNASGVAMMLYLAEYYSKHPQRYTIVFIAFAGEEAGLMGSEFFVTHPMVPLKNIRFLLNMDIMGDATDGITVVNGTEFPKEFELLYKINDDQQYLPKVVVRGPAANSDHYYFYKQGVPSFFVYTNGGKGYYHDVYDKPNDVWFTNGHRVVRLLIDFVKDIN